MLGGHTQFSEGGLSHDVTWLAERHGLVPAEAYPGRPADARLHDHEELFRLLGALVKELTGESKPTPSPRAEAAIAAVVDAYLGTPPRKVVVDGREMTPETYAKDVLKLRLDDYVELMSYSYAPFHANAELLVPDNWLHYGGYRNVPIDEFMSVLDRALERGYSVALDIDVSEPGFQPRRGVAHLSDALEQTGAVTQEVRDRMFADRSTTDDHLMHVVGLAVDEEGRLHYFTKDSGGPTRGPYEGYTFLSQNYVRAKALGLMVHKDVLSRP
jgi:bleomycin hydrolase